MSIPQGWNKVILRDLCESYRYGYTAKAQKEPIGPKFLRITDIVPDIIDWSSVPHCKINTDQIEKYQLRKGDIVIARTGATTGYAKQIKRGHNAVFASYLVRLRIAEEHDARFIGHVVESDVYKQFIQTNLGGAAQPNANAQILTSFPLLLPPLPVQRKIAGVLSAYDDLIENNARRIALLEELAQLLYREWFVRFRFPGHEAVERVASELGPIPAGWEVVKVSEIVKRLTAGTRYKQKNVSEAGQVPVISQSQERVVGFHDNEPDHKATPANPIIAFGDHTCKMVLMIEPFSVGANVVPFVGRRNLSSIYLYFLTKDLVSTREYKRHWTDLKNRKVILAPKKSTERFSDLVRPFFRMRDSLLHRNRTLRTIRDLLLPRLVSGEVDVSEVAL
jgi:type I restriction enzyme S subunit